VRVGEGIVFAVGGRVVAIRIEALGDRRGPPAQARTLYSSLGGSLGESLAPPAD